MSPTFKQSEIPAPRFLPAIVVIAALIVLAGLVSLHAGASEPTGVAIAYML